LSSILDCFLYPEGILIRPDNFLTKDKSHTKAGDGFQMCLEIQWKSRQAYNQLKVRDSRKAQTSRGEYRYDEVNEVTNDGGCAGRLYGREHGSGERVLIGNQERCQRVHLRPPGNLTRRQGQARLQGTEFVQRKGRV
jgi:hypothetical protein